MNGSNSLRGARVLVTGAARGIGAALAGRLHRRGARVALAGLEPEQLGLVASACGNAPWAQCDVRDRLAVDAAVSSLVEQLGGLDVVVANAGVAAQLPVVGGNPETFEQTIEVNLLGTYYTLRACGPHLLHDRGYALVIASLGGAVHLPLMGAYAASKSGVEALANSLRAELRPAGTRVGVAYFAELDTDMTRRGFGTRAARAVAGRTGAISGVSPLAPAIDALERGIVSRSRIVVSPWWVRPLLPLRGVAQRVVERALRGRVEEAVELARAEDAPMTTRQPARGRAGAAS